MQEDMHVDYILTSYLYFPLKEATQDVQWSQSPPRNYFKLLAMSYVTLQWWTSSRLRLHISAISFEFIESHKQKFIKERFRTENLRNFL